MKFTQRYLNAEKRENRPWRKPLHPTKKKTRPPRKGWRFFLTITLWSLLFLSVAGGTFTYFTVKSYLKDLPDVTNINNFIFAEATTFYDSTGTVVLYSLHDEAQNRKVVPLSEINQNIINAFLAVEDSNFFLHNGYDIGGIMKAGCNAFLGNPFGFCPPRGGSTITQQFVKNFILKDNSRTIRRKVRELYLSYHLEKNFEKEKILEGYLNGISFSNGIQGVERASEVYFQKSARDVSIAEAAILASLAKGPTKYSPFGENAFSQVLLSPEDIAENKYETFDDIHRLPGITWREGLVGRERELANGKTAFFPGRADKVALAEMFRLGFISQTELEIAKKELSQIVFPEFRENITAPHFVFWVMNLLEQKYFVDNPDILKNGGLKIITTLDLKSQKKAEEIIEAAREKNMTKYDANNAALVAIDAKGFVRVMVGSADYWDKEINGEVNVATSQRAPGSTFKPITYAAAFLAGQLAPSTVLFDVKMDFGSGWVVHNFDGKYHGPISVRKALGYSLNVPAVKASVIAGYKNVYDLAEKLGISFDQEADYYGNSIALGSGKASPLEMATAFSVFAKNGKKDVPVGILRIEDRFGNIIFQYQEPESKEVLPPAIAYLITNMLADFNARSPYWANEIQLSGRKNTAKTGTADKKVNNRPVPRDVWTIGSTPQLTTAVWVGNTNGKQLNKNASGASVAAPIWKDFMTAYHEDVPAEDFLMPEGLTKIQISRLSGKLPSEKTDPAFITDALFATTNIPTLTDDSLEMVEIDRVSQKRSTEMTPPAAREERAFLHLQPFYPENTVWKKAVDRWMESEENRKILRENLGLGEAVIKAAPTESDDAHNAYTERRKPVIDFLQPKKDAVVSPPQITLVPNISAKNGFRKVSFFWNGQKRKTFTKPQREYTIRIPHTATGKNTLQMKVTDQLYYETEITREVLVGADETPPLLQILSPQKGAILGGGSQIALSVNATDKNGAVRKVEFFVDDVRVGIDISSPFEASWNAPNTTQKYRIRIVATDASGNKSDDERILSVQERKNEVFFGFLSPKSKSQLSCTSPTTFSAATIRTDFSTMEFFAISPSGETRALHTIKNNGRTQFSFSFLPTECGRWRFFQRAIFTDGSNDSTRPITIDFQ